MSGFACKREDCDAEFQMRALEAIRAERIASGAAPTKSINEYYLHCKVCGRTPGFKRSEDGLVKAL